jgi:fumarate reductase (CoM/CoB) subunit A
MDFRSVRFILAPEAHFFMGGVDVDIDGQSSLTALFCCGENAGGVHGANRLNSNAVPETQVFGHRAGVAAARAASARSYARIDDRRLAHWRERLQSVNADGRRPAHELMALFEEQRNAVGVGLGIVRNRSGLERLLSELERIRERVAAAEQRRLVDLLAALELEDMCDVGRACASSALVREESRGAHFRDDHQDTDPLWVKTVVYCDGAVTTRAICRDLGEESWESAAAPESPASEEFVE